MGYLSCEDKLSDLKFLSLEKRKLWWDLIVAFQYPKAADKKAGEGLIQEHVVTGQGVMAANGQRVGLHLIKGTHSFLRVW